MQFVHTADNHLNMPISSLGPHKAALRRQQRLSSFSKIIDYTLKNADFLLISGDLFDTPNPPASIAEFTAGEFARLGRIPVFIALGNHDYSLNVNFPGNVHIFPGKFESITYKDCTITGISFYRQYENFSSIIPPACSSAKKNILLLHGDIFTKSEYNPMNKELLLSLGYDYIALGHIHEHYRFKNIVYPGCHDGAGFDECGEKSFISASFTQYGLSISQVPSSSLIYEEKPFDISPFSSSLALASSICDTFPDGIYKFILTGTPKEGFVPNLDFIDTFLNESFFFAKIEDKTDLTSFSEGMLYKLFCEHVASYPDADTARLALNYGISALKGDLDI